MSIIKTLITVYSDHKSRLIVIDCVLVCLRKRRGFDIELFGCKTLPFVLVLLSCASESYFNYQHMYDAVC